MGSGGTEGHPELEEILREIHKYGFEVVQGPEPHVEGEVFADRPASEILPELRLMFARGQGGYSVSVMDREHVDPARFNFTVGFPLRSDEVQPVLDQYLESAEAGRAYEVTRVITMKSSSGPYNVVQRGNRAYRLEGEKAGTGDTVGVWEFHGAVDPNEVGWEDIEQFPQSPFERIIGRRLVRRSDREPVRSKDVAVYAPDSGYQLSVKPLESPRAQRMGLGEEESIMFAAVVQETKIAPPNTPIEQLLKPGDGK